MLILMSEDSSAPAPEDVFRAPLPIDRNKYGLLHLKPEEKDAATLQAETELMQDAKEPEQERPIDPSVPLLYKPPFWSGRPKKKYELEMIREGISKGKRPLWQKGWYLFGRAPVCDIELQHPSISRQHAVIQFKKNDAPKDPEEETDQEDSDSGASSNNLNDGSDAAALRAALDERKKEKAPTAPAPEKKKSKRDLMQEELDEEDEELAMREAHMDFFKEMYAGDDDDSFFDRTGRIEKKQKKQREKAENVVETYDTLSARERTLNDIITELKKELENLGPQIEAAEQRVKETDAVEMEGFMARNEFSLLVDQRKRKQKLLKELEPEHQKFSKLASILKPALGSLVETSNITRAQIASLNHFEADLYRRKRESDGRSLSETEERQRLMKEQKDQMNELAKQRKAAAVMNAATKSAPSISSKPPAATPPPSKPSAPEPPKAFSPIQTFDETEKPKRRARNVDDDNDDNFYDDDDDTPASATDSEALNTDSPLPENDSLSTKRKGDVVEDTRTRKRPKKAKQRFDEEVSGAYDTWIPPTTQTGDGRSYLNDKFGY